MPSQDWASTSPRSSPGWRTRTAPAPCPRRRAAPGGGDTAPSTGRPRTSWLYALRTATARGHRHIGDEHLLLALTARPGLPAEVLADHGVTHASVTRVLYGDGEAKAG